MARFVIGILVVSSMIARAAALVPVPVPQQPTIPVVGLEANRGQAKAGILFLIPESSAAIPGGGASIAITAQAVLYSPVGASLNFVASNPNPTVSFSNPLPGIVNYYSGDDPNKWVTGIPRYGTADLAGIYPGINAEYTIGSDGTLTLNLLLNPGIDPKTVQFQILPAASLRVNPDGSLTVTLGRPGEAVPQFVYPTPVAFQTTSAGQVSRNASFTIQSGTNFGLVVQGVDPTLPLHVSIRVDGVYLGTGLSSSGQTTSDAAGNTFIAARIADAAGKDAPFPAISSVGCGYGPGQPVPCSDVAIYKYSPAGVLQFITYLAGETNESPEFVGLASGGALVVAGTTDSADFPVTAGAFQTSYAGPAPTLAYGSALFSDGDFFAAVLDPTTGRLQSATFFGGPNPDTPGTAAIGNDGSLYFLPAFTVHSSAGLPVSSAALLSACQSDPCYNGYAARLSPSLDKLIYGTYLPGQSQATAQLYSDGSVYYAGTAPGGFPTTPGAYQTQNAGGYDGIVARLDPTGSKLLFATYFGGPKTDWILSIALAPDGSVWANASSFLQCCIDIQPQLIHLDASGARLLANVPVDAGPMTVDTTGNLFALAQGSIAVSPSAILGGSCGGPAYVKLSPLGQQLFATYLPGESQIAFGGADALGTPYIDIPSGRFQVVENQPTPTNVGCVVDAASFSGFYNGQQVSPGEVVTIFGAGLGPSQGVGFQFANGKVPTSLGGTQVLVGGEPAPILYASYGQVNLIVPYDLPAGTVTEIQVITNGKPLNQLSKVQIVPAYMTLFQANRAAVALNQDYTVNSPQNPAKPGSTVMLFGTGGGQTSPPSMAGEVTPLELRPLVITPQAAIVDIPQNQPPAIFLNVDYAGAAPTLLSGVTQLNVTLPATIPLPEGYPPGTLPLQVVEPGMPSYQVVTIYAAVPPTSN